MLYSHREEVERDQLQTWALVVHGQRGSLPTHAPLVLQWKEPCSLPEEGSTVVGWPGAMGHTHFKERPESIMEPKIRKDIPTQGETVPPGQIPESSIAGSEGGMPV